MNLGISGLASGFDWQSLVEQIMEVERAPQRTLRADQTKIQQRNEAYTSIKSQLQTLQTKAQALKEASLFDSRAPAISDSTIASATSSPGAIQGAFSFHITQLATAAVLQGASNLGANLHSTDITASSPEPDSSPTLENAGFALPVTGGTFTLNGKTVTVSTTDTLRQVFNKIKTETGIDASYDSETDTISLSSANPIVVGGPNDTSNFLSAARLYFNNTGSITSSVALGAAKPNAALSEGNFNTAILDGGSGAGEFKINGVSITFNATEDGLANVLTRINESNAGVVATYDAVNDRLQLTNKNTGDSGVALEDVTGNFLAATGLTAGTLQRGKNLTYTLNNGGTLTSASNTITEESSGLTGLKVTALKAGDVTVQVGIDNSTIKKAIEDFVSEYNKTQSLIDTYTASSTDAKGKVTAGVLAGDLDASDIARSLRGMLNSSTSGLTGLIQRVDQIGYTTNSNNDTINLENAGRLEDVISKNLNGLKEFFSHETGGLASRLDQFIEKTIGDGGTLVKHQDMLTEQSGKIDVQITELERIVQMNQERMTNSFIAMEEAQARINQQLAYLQQQLGIS